MKRIVAGGRGGKMPSLHIDLQKGKTKSEVAVLNGAVVEAGWKTGVPTPVNAVLTETLMAIARGKLDWDEFRDRPGRLIDVAGSKQGHGEQVRG
jgi:2-dehydropantoate 2-reductase